MPDDQKEEKPSRWTFGRIIKIAIGAYAAIVLIPIIIGVFMARADPERASAVMAYFRDLLLVIIFLAGFIVVVGIGILLVQLAALTGVLRLEVGEIGKEVRGAFKAIRGAATFIAESVAAPAIRVLSFISGAFRFVGEVTAIRRLLRRQPRTPNPPQSG